MDASTTHTDVVVLTSAAALAAMYFRGLKHVQNSSISLILIFAIAFSVVGFFTLPFDSTDVFFYMATGWAQAHYQSNPYSTSLRETGAVGDPMVYNEWMQRSRNPWLDLPLPYGFLFALIGRAIAWLGQGNFWTTLALFKLLNLMMHIGVAYLLWKASPLVPDRNVKTVLYLYTWNPLVVLEYLANVHNDILIAFFVVLAAYALVSGRSFWIIPTLTAAALIKYVTVILVPFAFIFVVRQKGLAQAIWSVVLAGVLVAVTAIPYFGQMSAFKYRLIAAQLSESTGSLHSFLFYSYRAIVGLLPIFGSLSTFSAVIQTALWLLVAAFFVHQLYATWSDSSLKQETVIQIWMSILFAVIVVGSSKFWAWYLGMLLPLALLRIGKSRIAYIILLMSCTHMLSFGSFRTKAIGYVLVATIIPILYGMNRQPRMARIQGD